MAEAKSTAKDTLYIDVEDEITAVIDKVVNAKHKIIAVVLPKRATVFQSVVNMKLLKKAAIGAHKNLVLISSDKSVLSIAGTVEILVAKTPISKPYIPEKISHVPDDEPFEAIDNESTNQIAENETDDDEDTIEIDNTDDATETIVERSSKKKKLLKIPDFSSFRLRVTLASSAFIALIVLWVFGFVILPKATVIVNTDISTSSVDGTVLATVGGATLDLEKNILPAERVQIEKIDSVKVPATGEKNIGNKATGVMNLANCINDGEDKIIPAGTGFSSGSQTFVTTEAVTLDFAVFAGNNCLSKSFGRDKNVDVIATEAGPQYNLGARDYNSSISGIDASGSDMSGGTSQLVKVISVEDIKKAEAQLSGASKTTALSEMKQQLNEKGLTPIDETLGEGTPMTVNSPAVDTEASEVEVTMTVSYNLLGVLSDDLAKIIENEVQKSLGEKQQNIRDNGLGSVTFRLQERKNEAEIQLSIQTVATIGPEIDVEALKNDIVGKKRGDIEKQIEAIEGVRSVSVEYSPAWITTTPKSADKISIVFSEE